MEVDRLVPAEVHQMLAVATAMGETAIATAIATAAAMATQMAEEEFSVLSLVRGRADIQMGVGQVQAKVQHPGVSQVPGVIVLTSS